MWVDPSRDIAHVFLSYLERADRLMDNPQGKFMQWFRSVGGTEADREKLIKFWVEYVKQTGDLQGCPDQRTALINARLLDVPLPALLAGSYALHMVLLGAYFAGCRSATGVGSRGEDPATELAVLDVPDLQSRPWWRRQAIKFLRAILVRL